MISWMRRLRRIDLPTLRAALWTLRALRTVRTQLRRGTIEGVRVPAPPPLSEAEVRGVLAVLRRRPNTCLERSLVLQRWVARFDRAPDIVVGVASPSDGFRAHAWLEGEPDNADGQFHELMRLPSADNS